MKHVPYLISHTLSEKYDVGQIFLALPAKAKKSTSPM